MKRILDPHHPFFERPLWRWLTAVLPLLWAGVELYNQQAFWAVLFGATGVYAFVMLFVIRPKEISAAAARTEALPPDQGQSGPEQDPRRHDS